MRNILETRRFYLRRTLAPITELIATGVCAVEFGSARSTIKDVALGYTWGYVT